MKSFEGKKALVIGGSGGIGLAVASMLAAGGADVTVHGKNAEKLKKAAEHITKNCSEKAEVKTVNYEITEESLSGLENSELGQAVKNTDILAVCFGPFIQKSLEETTAEDWQKVALLDYALPGMVTSLALKNMMKNNWGRILLFGGTGTSFRSEYKTNAAYAGAKTGLGVVVQSVAAGYARYGITCNCILPGFVETEYVEGKTAEALKEKLWDGRLISERSIAKAAEFLLSGPDINGVMLRVDKGWSPAY